MIVRHGYSNQGPAAVGGGLVLDAALEKRLRGAPVGLVIDTTTSLTPIASVVEGELLYAWDGEHHSMRTFDWDEARIYLEQNENSHTVEIHVCGTDPDHARTIADKIKGKFDKLPIHDNKVYVTFWSWTDAHGAQSRRREIDSSSWESIKTNYPRFPQADLEGLSTWDQTKDFHGQLLLLHGPAGTGKTHAIRMLAQEWREWCDVHYVVDPEEFFGKASYMLSVLVDSEPENGKWKLIVVEDTDELIRVDGRRDTGQAMSRLLNLCDGLIGQGLRVLVLLTTNEEVTKLHPAIKRPGRCVANIAVTAFPEKEAQDWLTERKVEANISGEQTLADLYQSMRGTDEAQVITKNQERRAGFVT